MKYKVHIDLDKNQLQNARAHNLSSAPSSPGLGQVYYNTTDNIFYFWNGTSWVAAGAESATGPAGGDLSGTYPNPDIAAGVIVNADISAGAAIALSKLAADPLARANHTGTQLASTISDFDTQVRTNRLDQMAAPTASVSLSSQKITNLATPTGAADAVTKAYVDGLTSGVVDFKASVRVATTANGTLATAFENGDTVDGVTLATGDRILIKSQSTAAENGIYTVNASGAPTRAVDADAEGEISVGTLLYVESGTANGGQLWICSAIDTASWTPGTDGSTWALYFAVTSTQAGAGLLASGNVLAVGAGAGILVNANDVAVDTSVVVRKFAQAFGDGAATSFTITHNLGTRDVTTQIYLNSGSFEKVEADVEHTDTNTVTIRFATAPASNAYRVVVHG